MIRMHQALQHLGRGLLRSESSLPEIPHATLPQLDHRRLRSSPTSHQYRSHRRRARALPPNVLLRELLQWPRYWQNDLSRDNFVPQSLILSVGPFQLKKLYDLAEYATDLMVELQQSQQ